MVHEVRAEEVRVEHISLTPRVLKALVVQLVESKVLSRPLVKCFQAHSQTGHHPTTRARAWRLVSNTCSAPTLCSPMATPRRVPPMRWLGEEIEVGSLQFLVYLPRVARDSIHARVAAWETGIFIITSVRAHRL